ncbi:hypothetical protein FO519_005854 [Halicephalobus sp. NKZ332]|nr:hypothetical protein FO519_005854 [Halicephalobus sp. NKZ332]
MNITTTQKEMMWQKFRTYHHGFYASIGSIGILLNLLLWRTIVKKTPEQISAYARVLKLCCIVNLMYACCICLDHNILLVKENIVFVIMNGFFRNPPVCIRFIQVVCHNLILSLNFVMIPIPFVYRYFFICKNKMLTNFELAKTKPDFKVAASTCLTVMFFLYGAIIVCGWRIYQKLRGSKKFNRTIGFQKQMTRALTFQAFTPAVFIFGPMAISIIQASIEKGGIGISLILAAIMACYPIADPVITIIFVTPYYNAIFGRFIRKRKQDTTETPETIHRETQISEIIQRGNKTPESI